MLARVSDLHGTESALRLSLRTASTQSDYLVRISISCPSSEPKPIDLGEAANGKAILPNDLGYPL